MTTEKKPCCKKCKDFYWSGETEKTFSCKQTSCPCHDSTPSTERIREEIKNRFSELLTFVISKQNTKVYFDRTDDVEKFLSQEIEKARKEERERIAKEFRKEYGGDFMGEGIRVGQVLHRLGLLARKEEKP